MNNFKSLLYSAAFVLVFSYLGVCSYFYVVQESILFHPRVIDENAAYNFAFEFSERWFEPEEEVRIHAIHARSEGGKGLVYFMPGNAGMNRGSSAVYTLFLDQGYDVIYADYRGFGKSRGELHNEEDLVGDADFVYSEMLKEYPEQKIVLVGYSLGTGIAAQLASRHDPSKLILWTPYYSMLDMKDYGYSFLPDALLRYPLRTDEALQKIDEPVYLFYAENDRVLPVERSIRLRKFLKDGDAYFMLRSQGHNQVYRNETLINQLHQILNTKG